MPATCPVCGTPDRPRRGRRPPLLPQPPLSGPGRPGVRPLRRARRDGHRGCRLGRARAAPPARLVKRRGDFFRLTVEQLESSTDSRARAPRTCTARSSARAGRPLARIISALGIPQVGWTDGDRPGRLAGRALPPADGEPMGGSDGWLARVGGFLRRRPRATAGGVRASPRRRADRRREPGRATSPTGARRVLDRARRCRRRARAPAPLAADRRRRAGRPLAGKTRRRHRHAPGLRRARRPRTRSGRPAGRPAGRSRRRPTTWSPARTPARSSPRRRSSASRSSTRPASGAARRRGTVTDRRGRLESDPYEHRLSADGSIRIPRGGRVVAVVRGDPPDAWPCGWPRPSRTRSSSSSPGRPASTGTATSAAPDPGSAEREVELAPDRARVPADRGPANHPDERSLRAPAEVLEGDQPGPVRFGHGGPGLDPGRRPRSPVLEQPDAIDELPGHDRMGAPRRPQLVAARPGHSGPGRRCPVSDRRSRGSRTTRSSPVAAASMARIAGRSAGRARVEPECGASARRLRRGGSPDRGRDELVIELGPEAEPLVDRLAEWRSEQRQRGAARPLRARRSRPGSGSSRCRGRGDPRRRRSSRPSRPDR